MRTGLLSIILILKMIFITDCCHAACSMDNDRNAIDTVKVIFFLDGEQVPYSTISEKGQKGELGSGYGWTDHKEAILQYGEKFRYGVMFIRSKEESKEEKPEK